MISRWGRSLRARQVWWQAPIAFKIAVQPVRQADCDGTLAHAVERMIGLLDKPTGMVKQCVSVTPPLTLDDLAGMGNG